VRLLRFASLTLALAFAACATAGSTGRSSSGLLLRGEHAGKRLLFRASAVVASGGTGRLTLEVMNRGEEPIGFDLDSISLQDPEGATFLPRGSTGAGPTPQGAASIAPGATQQFALEFDRLPVGKSLTVIVPAMYRLTIDGQTPMNAIGVPLEPAPAAGAQPEARFFDPFVEW
jgi:hypothetical protein